MSLAPQQGYRIVLMSFATDVNVITVLVQQLVPDGLRLQSDTHFAYVK